MKNIVYILFLFIFFSCDDALFDKGPVVTKQIETDDFREIYVEDIFDIYLLQDTMCKISVKGGSNVISNIHFEVDADGKLTISDSNTNRWSRDYERSELYISVDTLYFLRLNQPSYVYCVDTLITPELKIFSIADYTDIHVKLNCNNCYVVNSGTSGGYISIEGNTNSFSFWARAALRIDALNFASKYVTVESESIGDCKVNVSKQLSVEILNSGDVFYTGNPDTIIYINEQAKDKLFKVN